MVKEQEIEQLQHCWHEETNNIHQQTKEEIKNEREKLMKVTFVISSLILVLFEKKYISNEIRVLQEIIIFLPIKLTVYSGFLWNSVSICNLSNLQK
jgi:hypothetical protein